MPLIAYKPGFNIQKHDKCYSCGTNNTPENRLEKHRIKPGEYGGTYEISNICILCSVCHHIVHRLILIHGVIDSGWTWQDFIEAAKEFRGKDNGCEEARSQVS